MTHLATIGKQSQFRCDYAACAKTFWLPRSRRARDEHFCSADCRQMKRIAAEREAAEQLLHEVNGWYGDGRMRAMGLPNNEPLSGFPQWAREQYLCGLLHGREIRQGAVPA